MSVLQPTGGLAKSWHSDNPHNSRSRHHKKSPHSRSQQRQEDMGPSHSRGQRVWQRLVHVSDKHRSDEKSSWLPGGSWWVAEGSCHSLVLWGISVSLLLMHAVVVAVPPDILDYPTSTDMVVREGNNVTLQCVATGFPPPTIVWKREQGEPIVLGNGEEGE